MMAQSQRKTGAMTLEQARTSLAEVDAGLAKLGGDREAALIAGADDEAIAKIDERIEGQQRVRRTNADRVSLMQKESDRLAAEKIAREKAAHIERVLAVLAERNVAAAALQKHVIAAERSFREVDRLNSAIRAAWPFSMGDLDAILCTSGGLLLALQSYLYKVGARPALLGGQETPGGTLSFPGGRCPRLEDAHQQHKLPDLADVFADASKHAAAIMHGRRDSPVPAHLVAVAEAASAKIGDVPQGDRAPAAPVQAIERTPAQIELVQLLNEQHRLAMSDRPEDEDLYHRNGARIAQLSEGAL
jgi:hypothetical protein